MYGIENLKKMVKFACDFTKEVATAMSDGKFQWSEAFGFIDEIMQIPGVVKSWPEVKQEIGELSLEERQALYDYLVTEFDIPNDEVEAKIEASLQWVLNTIALIEGWRKKPEPQA